MKWLNSDDGEVRRGLLARIRRELRPFTAEMYRRYLNKAWGMDIGPDCMISMKATLDRSYPRGHPYRPKQQR